MTNLRCVVAVALLYAVASSTCGQDASGDPGITIEEVIAGLKKAEQSIKTLSVVINSKQNIQIDGDVFGSGDRSIQTTRLNLRESWQLDAQGRGWNKVTGTRVSATDGKIRLDQQIGQHSTFDGDQGRVVTTETNPLGNKAHRGALTKSMRRFGMTPFDFTVTHAGESISGILELYGGKVVGEEEWEGRTVIAVEIEPIITESQHKSDFLIDPARGFSVVRRRDHMRFAATQQWWVTRSISSLKHTEVADGIWLPSIVSSQWFARPADDQVVGKVLQLDRLVCSDWKINEEIPKEAMTLDFPAGLKVQGMLRAFQAKQTKLKNFFVDPVLTPLQRRLIGAKGIVAYASLDVTAFVDVNTHQITPGNFDFAAFAKRLKEVHGQVEPGTLFLHFDFGGLGTDELMLTFVREPVKSLCKKSGFQNVRVSNTFHNDDKVWQPPQQMETDRPEEPNLGNEKVSVFPVRTRLSRFLAKGMHCLIELNEPIGVDAKQLFSDDVKEVIEDAVPKEELDGATVHVKLIVGSLHSPLPRAGDLPPMQQDSDIQLAAVEFLRSFGFQQIRLTVANGFSQYVSHYRKK